jgi:cyclin-dependent kinase 12/13
MGCVYGRPSAASTPDDPSSRRQYPAASQKEGVSSAAAAAEAAAETGEKVEQPAAVAVTAPVKRERRSRSSRHGPAAAEVRLGGSFANKARGEQVAAGWPAWLCAVAGEAINGWTPRRADSFEKIDKVRAPTSPHFLPAAP